MAFTKVLQVILLAVVGTSSAVDYCALPTCLDKHVACNNKGNFSENCPKDVREVKIEPHHKLILTLFNELRNNVAGVQAAPILSAPHAVINQVRIREPKRGLWQQNECRSDSRDRGSSVQFIAKAARSSNKAVTKFTIAVAEKNTHVGCAAVRFSRDFYNHFVLTCNFATSNIVGQPVYTPGEKATTGCKNRYGAAYDYPNLCYAKEIYDNEKVIENTQTM
ncbi:uncharacterized protein Dsimw501_GD18744 [Drosophila simulans]|nr:uncharacterized protein Dsimw501_GD18744 [Drosophila simulans]